MCLYSMLLMLNMVQHRMMNDKHMMCSDHVDMFQEIVNTICIMRVQILTCEMLRLCNEGIFSDLARSHCDETHDITRTRVEANDFRGA